METRTLTKQTIRKSYQSSLEVATRYYTMLSVLNDLHLTPRELQLLAFTATRGSISSGGSKEQFVQLYKTSVATIGNLISDLMKRGYLVKEGKAIRIHPSLRINFSHPLLLQLLIEKPENASTEGK